MLAVGSLTMRELALAELGTVAGTAAESLYRVDWVTCPADPGLDAPSWVVLGAAQLEAVTALPRYPDVATLQAESPAPSGPRQVDAVFVDACDGGPGAPRNEPAC